MACPPRAFLHGPFSEFVHHRHCPTCADFEQSCGSSLRPVHRVILGKRFAASAADADDAVATPSESSPNAPAKVPRSNYGTRRLSFARPTASAKPFGRDPSTAVSTSSKSISAKEPNGKPVPRVPRGQQPEARKWGALAGIKLRQNVELNASKWDVLPQFREGSERQDHRRAIPRIWLRYALENPPAIWGKTNKCRDHCQCSECVHPVTKQRQFDTFSVSCSSAAIAIFY